MCAAGASVWKFSELSAGPLAGQTHSAERGGWTQVGDGFTVTSRGMLSIAGKGGPRFAYSAFERGEDEQFSLIFEVAGWHVEDAGARTVYVGLAHSHDRHRAFAQVRFRLNERGADVSAQAGGSAGDGATAVRGVRIGQPSQLIAQRYALSVDLKNRRYTLFRFTGTGHWAEIGSGTTSAALAPKFVFVGAEGDFNTKKNERWELRLIHVQGGAL